MNVSQYLLLLPHLLTPNHLLLITVTRHLNVDKTHFHGEPFQKPVKENAVSANPNFYQGMERVRGAMALLSCALGDAGLALAPLASDDAGCSRAEATHLSRLAVRGSRWLAPHQNDAGCLHVEATHFSCAAMRGPRWLARISRCRLLPVRIFFVRVLLCP